MSDFLHTYTNTDLQLFKMFIAILCLNGVEQPFKGRQFIQFFFLPLRRRSPRLRRGSLRPRGGRRTQRPPPPGSAPRSDTSFRAILDMKSMVAFVLPTEVIFGTVSAGQVMVRSKKVKFSN